MNPKPWNCQHKVVKADVITHRLRVCNDGDTVISVMQAKVISHTTYGQTIVGDKLAYGSAAMRCDHIQASG
jgi:hypothetical protein